MTKFACHALFALSFLIGFAPAIAAPPPPIPALPDTSRLTTYTPTASTGPFNVGFDVYGDGTDYGNWLEVWVNGVKLTPVTGWSLSSPSGPINLQARPITDARVTLTNAATGTVQIVGARRPRRASQFQVNPAPRDFNQALTDLTAQNREMFDLLQSRTLKTIPGTPVGGAGCINKFIGFDDSGAFTVCRSGAGSGNVIGPVASAVNNIATYNATDGSAIRGGAPVGTLGDGTNSLLALQGGSGAGNGATIQIAGQGVTHFVGNSAKVLGTGSAADLTVFAGGTSPILMFTNNAERFRVDGSTGFVGINKPATTPTANLDIGGTLKASAAVNFASTLGITGNTTVGDGTNANLSLQGGTGTANGSALQLSGQGVTHSVGTFSKVFGTGTASDLTVFAGGTTPILLYTNNAERIRIDGSTGNVGIGNPGTAPANKLDVYGTFRATGTATIGDASSAALSLSGGTGSGLGGVVQIIGQGVTHLIGTESKIIGTGTSAALDIYLASANPIKFFTNNANRMTIGADGTVTLPYALNISGNPALSIPIGTNPYLGSNSIASQAIQATSQSATLPEAGLQIINNSAVGGAAPTQAFKMGLFASVTASPGSADIYPINAVGQLSSGVAGSVNGLVIETDINVNNAHYGDPAAAPTLPYATPFYVAFGGQYRSTAAMMVNLGNFNTVNTPYAANHGIVFWNGAFRQNTITDYTSAGSFAQINGTYGAAAIDMSQATLSSNVGVKLPNAKFISWRNAANSADVAAVSLNSSNQVAIGASMTVSGDITYTGSSWTPYTPTASCVSGTATWGTLTNAGKYKVDGKKVNVILGVPMSSLGSCAVAVSLTLPFTSVGIASLSGRETNVNGKMINGYVSGGQTMTVVNYDNTVPGGTSTLLTLSGTYEIP